MSSAAKRQRQARYRARQRDCRMIVRVEMTVDQICWLESQGLLSATCEQDRERIGEALLRYVESAMSATADRQPAPAVRLVKAPVR